MAGQRGRSRRSGAPSGTEGVSGRLAVGGPLGQRAVGCLCLGAWTHSLLPPRSWLCGCLGRGSTGPSSRRAGRGPGHKTRVAAPAGEPGASHKGRLGGRLRQQWQSRRAVGEGKRCHAGQELRRNVRAVHEQHSQLFRAQAQFSSSGSAVSDSSAAPARAYPPPAPLRRVQGRTRQSAASVWRHGSERSGATNARTA